MQFACECFYQYIYGRLVQLETDHKLLEGIFEKKYLMITQQDFNWFDSVQKYLLQVSYIPWKSMHAADDRKNGKEWWNRAIITITGNSSNKVCTGHRQKWEKRRYMPAIKTKRNVDVFWPGKNKDIEIVAQYCNLCMTFRDAQLKQPLISHQIPTRP